ncbi:hypothetical protein [Microcoleus vaginatus]|uniref:hypothetical protein n=1 Tax=Microcoleus vaginatus TaxID=119532 RepID=UPI001688D64E|nr:hypothetical protein [Microcoleus sp. FACHB-84]MBD2008622.1 hypothetical protein [Microcoleus sp. FACHB-45]
MLCPNPSICYCAGYIKCDRLAKLLRSESIDCYSHPQINMTFTGYPDSAPGKTSSRA